MLQKAAHEVVRELGKLSVAVLVIEEGLAVLDEEHVNVHPVARFAEYGLGHEGRGAAVLNGVVLDYVLGDHGVVGHLLDIGKLDLYLKLTGAADLVMMVLDLYAPFVHQLAHMAAQVVILILRSADVVAALVGDLGAVGAVAGVPIGLVGVYLAPYAVGSGFELDLVEYVELEFGPDYHFIGDAAFTHVVDGGADDVAGILIERTVRGAVDYHGVAAHGKGVDLGKGIDGGGGKIGDKDHVAVLNGSIAVVGTVKAYAVGHCVFGETSRGDGDVPPATVDIGHFEIDHFDVVFFDEFLSLFDVLEHKSLQKS